MPNLFLFLKNARARDQRFENMVLTPVDKTSISMNLTVPSAYHVLWVKNIFEIIFLPNILKGTFLTKSKLT